MPASFVFRLTQLWSLASGGGGQVGGACSLRCGGGGGGCFSPPFPSLLSLFCSILPYSACISPSSCFVFSCALPLHTSVFILISPLFVSFYMYFFFVLCSTSPYSSFYFDFPAFSFLFIYPLSFTCGGFSFLLSPLFSLFLTYFLTDCSACIFLLCSFSLVLSFLLR